MKRGAPLLVFALAAVTACTKEDSLILLDLRTSGPLGAPNTHVRLSAKGWKTRTVGGTIGVEGLRVGYYGPGDGGGVSVLAEALDGVDCVLGSGSAAVPALKAGATTEPTKLFIRALPANGCVPDAGTDAGIDAGVDVGTDAGTDAGEDAGVDAEVDATEDSGSDADVDAGTDATDDGASAD
ncbi:MAG TPA: hypothetical protein VIQ54_21700 [Polyangia bacterium]|jgi:hypothetical protein